jgi:hypothetical protein
MNANNFSEVRNQRNQRLAQSDWTQMADSPLSDEQKAAWAAYRQQLRELPANIPTEIENWFDVSFPVCPQK